MDLEGRTANFVVFYKDATGPTVSEAVDKAHAWLDANPIEGVTPRFAGGIIGTTAAAWWTGGRDVYSAELEGLLRIHPVTGWPVFLDGSGGYQLANDQIPPGGTVWNFTFSFGAGIEVPIDRGVSLLTGVQYHHISNALGRESPRNPSQNEARLWVGFAWEF